MEPRAHTVAEERSRSKSMRAACSGLTVQDSSAPSAPSSVLCWAPRLPAVRPRNYRKVRQNTPEDLRPNTNSSADRRLCAERKTCSRKDGASERHETRRQGALGGSMSKFRKSFSTFERRAAAVLLVAMVAPVGAKPATPTV